MTTRQCWIDINFLSQWTKPRRVIFITHFLHIIKDTRRHGQELLYKICKAYSMMKTFIKNSFFLLLYHCSICQRNSILCFGENQEWLWDFYKNSFEDHHCKFCQLERLSRAVTGPAQSLFWSEPGSSYVWTPVASDSFYCQVPTLHGLPHHWLTAFWGRVNPISHILAKIENSLYLKWFQFSSFPFFLKKRTLIQKYWPKGSIWIFSQDYFIICEKLKY